jgi:hypothetical protein
MSKVLKTVGITFLCLTILFLLIFLFIFIKSKVWERNFQANLNPEYISNQPEEFEEALNKKIEEYVLSQEDTDFITFTPKEVAQIVYGSVSQMVEGSSIEITNVYVEPSLGVWKVCARSKVRDIERFKIWVCADVTKDNIQTAQLYVTELTVQGFSMKKVYPKVITEINQGIAEALVTANENGFVGRVFENMELLENTLIIKGSLY